MAKQTISLGTAANDGTGDPLRTAFTKTNANFTELYTADASLQPLDADLTAIAALVGTSGFLKKTSTNTWTLDTSTYLTAITSNQVTTALGYTPYNGATNSSAFLTGITSAQIISALGYTPYSAANPTGYVTSAQANIPDQTGNSGKFLTTNGTALSWAATSTITSLGTIATGVWNGTVVAGQYGGTGVANTGKTITLGGNLTTSGAFATTLTATATTSVTLPTTGTLATLDGTETLINKTLTSPKSNEILDTNGNKILSFLPTTSSTDYLVVQNGIGVGAPVHILTDGSSANIGLHIQTKGSGLVSISDGSDFNKSIRFRCSSSASSVVTLIDAVSTAGRVITLPDATDTLVGRATTDTLTNKTAGIATTSSTASSLGYLGIPQSATATTATLAIGDAGKHIYVTTAGQTITIPANASVAYPIGTTIGFIAGPSATTVTIAITSDTMYLGGTGTTGSRTLAAHGMATAVKVAATTWYISGNGLT